MAKPATSPSRITITNCRLAFPALWEPKAVQAGDEPAYSAVFLLPADDKQVATIEKLIDQVATEKWGAKAPAILKGLRAKDKTCLHDGDTKAQYAGFEGTMFVSARNKTRPLVVDRDKSPLTARDGKPYAGAMCNGQIDLWAMDNKYGQRICASLVAVQFAKDADAFAGGAPADIDQFDDISNTGDDDDGSDLL